jgi:methyl-accepting chemotaxis protein
MSEKKRIQPIVKTNWRAVAWIVGGVFLPWIWAMFLLPLSVSLILAVCAAGVCVVLISQLAREVYVPKRRSDDASITADQIAKIRAAGLHTLLDRWSNISHNTNASLQGMHTEIDTVMGQTEEAVINIGNSFRQITDKTTAQMEYALGLLKSTRDTATDEKASGTEGAESLTDFIRSYEEMLSNMSNKLIHFSDVSLDLVQGQKKAQKNAREVDSLLGEMEAIAGRISLLALNTSVVSGGVAASERAFVEMSDKIRELSQSATEFNRRIRSHMQGMKSDLRTADESMASMALELKDVARTAQSDVMQVTMSMRNKNKEVTAILENINALGEEVKQDIYKIIMSLQFQDITQQRLEGLKNPLLNELSRHLSSITDETRVLNKKLQVPNVKGGLADKPFRVVGTQIKSKPESSVEQTAPNNAPPAASRELQPSVAGNDVELF